MMRWLCSVTLLGAACTASPGCGAPGPPEAPPPRVRAGQRLAWDQVASTPQELATLKFVFYVDRTESQLSDVSCGSEQSPKGFACSGILPAMTPGTRTLQVVAKTADGRLASRPSDPITVIVEALP